MTNIITRNFNVSARQVHHGCRRLLLMLSSTMVDLVVVCQKGVFFSLIIVCSSQVKDDSSISPFGQIMICS